MEEVLKDERFSHIFTDPRFRKIPKNVKKVKVDSRFKELIKGKKFKKKCHVDERGRALDLESSENLTNLYNMDEDSNESADDKSSYNKNGEKLPDSKNSVKKGKDKKTKKNSKKCSDLNSNLNREKISNSVNSDSDNQESNEINVKENCFISKSTDDSHTSNIDFEGKCSEEIKNEVASKHFKKNRKNELKKQNIDSSSNKINLKKTNIDSRFNSDIDTRFKVKESDEDTSESSDEVEDSFEMNNEISNANEEDSDTDSSSDSDDSDSEDSASNMSDEFDHQWEEHHERAPDTDEITRRLAVCHMDWDRIRAVDLYAVFNSFKPPDSSVLSVKIYPSEFGLKRMEEEKLNGPPELVEKTLASDEEEVEDKKGGKYNREKLRQYQMNRLKYYYAIVECDTPETANSLYEQLNGMEYESSSVRFDLRFVPDDMEFDQEPTSVSENIPDLTEYKPRLFVTTALQQVKVGLTWDETDPQRRETLQKAFTEPDSIEKDIKEYLASSSGDSEDEVIDEDDRGVKLSTAERIQKYKALLQSIDEQEKEKNEEKYEMEITWEAGMKEKTENLVKEKLEEKNITPFEELQRKIKEKQKLKKKEKKLYNKEKTTDSMSDNDDSDQSLDEAVKRKENDDLKITDELYLISDAKKVDENTTKVSKKKMKKKLKESKMDEDVKIDVNDPRFSSVYTSPLFNIDPSDPRFKKTPATLALIAEKQRRLKKKASQETNSENKRMKYI